MKRKIFILLFALIASITLFDSIQTLFSAMPNLGEVKSALESPSQNLLAFEGGRGRGG